MNVGAQVSSLNLGPILYKRLRIQGSTLRSRSVAYQADLIKRFQLGVGDIITGEDGQGPLRTYIYAVRFHSFAWWWFSLHAPILPQVYPMDKIQDAHRDMASNTTAGKLIVTVP